MVRILGVGFVVAWVPAFAVDLGSWPAAVVAAIVGVATKSWRTTGILAAYIIPELFGAPWPTHCLTGYAAWLLTRSVIARQGQETRREGPATTWRSIVAVLTLGTASGIIVVLLDYHSIVADPWWFPVQKPSTATLAAIVIAAAVVNAVGEELWWRTTLLALHCQLGTAPQYCFQAITFGIAHFHGIPSGLPGIGGAALYSTLCLWVHRRWGRGHAILTHTVTDLVVFTVIARTATFAFS